jgi:oligosaccharyltransferase complex subunit gamma
VGRVNSSMTMRMYRSIVALATFLTCCLALEFDSTYVNSLKSRSGVIRLTDATFPKVVGGPRDYAIAVLLTAEGPQYGCAFCKVVGSPFEKVAASWNQDHPNGDGLFFAVADIAQTSGTYQQLGLKQAPNFWIYPPTAESSGISVGYDQCQFPATENLVQNFIDHIYKSIGKRVVIHEPFPWDRIFMSLGTIGLSGAILKIAYPVIIRIFRNKQLWIAVSLVTILMFTAGHMFNMIRKTPYVTGDGHGGVVYFVGGHSTQVAIETQIIAIVYAILSFSTISLIVKVPKIKHPQAQLFAVSLLGAVILLTFSFLMAKFHIKNGAYPLHLLRIF